MVKKGVESIQSTLVLATSSASTIQQESEIMLGFMTDAISIILPILLMMMLVSLGFKIIMHGSAFTSSTSSTSSDERTKPLVDVDKLKKTFRKKMKNDDFTIADQRKLFDAVLTLFNYRLKAADAPLSVKIVHIQKFIKKYEEPVVDFTITEHHILIQAAWEWLCANETMNFDDDNVIKGQFQKLKVELSGVIEKTYAKVKEAEQSIVSAFLEEEKMIVNSLESTVDELREQLRDTRDVR